VGLVPTVWVSRLQAVFGAVYWNILKYGFCCFFNIKILAFYRYIQSWWQIWQYLWPHFGWIYFHISYFGWIYYLSRYILDSWPPICPILRWNYFQETVGGCWNRGCQRISSQPLTIKNQNTHLNKKKRPLRVKPIRKNKIVHTASQAYIYICASHNGPSLFQGSVHRSGWTPSTTGRSSVFELEWNLLGEMNFHLYHHGILVIPWYPICNVTARPYGSPGRLEQRSNIVLQHAKKPVQGQRFGISQTTNPKP
jgi:hypothetical protein